MLQLDNVKVSKVIENVFSGEGEYGMWYLHNLIIDGDKFSLFGNENTCEIQAGDTLLFIEYEQDVKTKNGKAYTNRTIKKFKKVARSSPAPDPNSKTSTSQSQAQQHAPANGNQKDNPFWFVLSYAKDLQVARIAKIKEIDTIPLKDFMKEVYVAAKGLMKEIEKDNKATTSNFKFLEAVKGFKKDLGQELYDQVKKAHSVKKANEITTRKDQVAFFKDLEKALKIKVPKEKEPDSFSELDEERPPIEEYEVGTSEIPF